MKLDGLRADWQRLSALLDEGLSLDEADRAAWLASLDGDAATHRETLERLLADAGAVETDDRFAVLPPFDLPREPHAGAAADAAPSELVGPYRLISELGRGGMGVVWLAERADAQPRRKVALKLPHIGWAPGLAARLTRERDILASLEHPNIARLYDAGVDALGRPYLALEYVDGTPIDRYGDAHALPLRGRLELVLKVAAAVAHAHTRLVVHRDLKPSNVLVTAAGELRLLDFGIARLLHDDAAGGEGASDGATEITRLGGRALTPDYASPEQIRGEAIGTSSDVYGLGVLAFELLAGSRPYRLKDVAADGLAEAIARVDVPLASRVATDPARARQLAGDLDAILNKALKKDPAERYAGVAAFADDIERYLRHEPVVARPDAFGYRLRKFVARNTVQVVAGTVVGVAVLAGSGVALWQARVARLEAAHAEQVKAFVLSILAGANEDSGANAQTTAADVLKVAATRIDHDLVDRPDTAVELMTAIGSGLLGLGRNDDAAALLRKAIALGTAKLGPQDLDTLAAGATYGETLIELGQFKEAKVVIAPIVDAARRAGAVPLEMQAMRALSSVQLSLGDLDGGIALAQAAVDAIGSSDKVRKNDEISAWNALANALAFADRPGLTNAARHSLALSRELFGDRITTPLLVARTQIGRGLLAENKTAAGLAELSSALDDSIHALGPTHPETSYIANYLGYARLEAGDPPGAVQAFQAAVVATAPTVDSSPSDLGTEEYGLGNALVANHDFEPALAAFETSARLMRKAEGADAPIALRALSARALTLARLGRLDNSERAFREIESAHWRARDKAGNSGRLSALRSLQGRHEEAVALARAAAAVFDKDPSPMAHATGARALGMALLAAGHPAEAIGPLQAATDLYAQRQIVVSPDRADTIAALSRARAAAAAAAASSGQAVSAPAGSGPTR